MGRGTGVCSFYSPFCFPAFVYLETLLNKKLKKPSPENKVSLKKLNETLLQGGLGRCLNRISSDLRDKSVMDAPPPTGSPGCTREYHPSLAAELLKATTSDLLPRHEVGSLKKTNKKAKKRPLGSSRAPLGTTEEGERKTSYDH